METPARILAARLQGGTFRYRTAVLELPRPWLGREAEIAVRLGMGLHDHHQWVLDRLAPGQRHLGLTWERLVSRDLDGIVQGVQPEGGCFLVANLDLALSALVAAERDRLWAYLRDSYRPRWGLLVALPSHDQRLINDTERRLWQADERLAAWT